MGVGQVEESMSLQRTVAALTIDLVCLSQRWKRLVELPEVSIGQPEAAFCPPFCCFVFHLFGDRPRPLVAHLSFLQLPEVPLGLAQAEPQLVLGDAVSFRSFGVV